MASEREGLPSCRWAQFSIADFSAGASRSAVTGSRPVADRPGFFRIFSFDPFVILKYNPKVQRADGKLHLPTGPNPSHGGKPWLRLNLCLSQVAPGLQARTPDHPLLLLAAL